MFLPLGWNHFNPAEFEPLRRHELMRGHPAFHPFLPRSVPTYAREIQNSEYGSASTRAAARRARSAWVLNASTRGVEPPRTPYCPHAR